MPFEEAQALVLRESAVFREGQLELRNWPEFVHSGSIAQVAPFVNRRESGVESEDRAPDGIVKMTFAKMREVMAVDFRLLRFQLAMMERTGHLMGVAGLEALRPKHLGKIKEVWRLMAEMEAEVMAEFDLRKEADAQERGQHLLEGLLGGSSGDCAWLEEWRDGALSSVLRPAGPAVTGHALKAWHAAGASVAGGVAGRGSGARPGLVTRLARQAFGGRAVAETLAAGEEHVNRLRVALRRLQVEVPSVIREAL